MTATRPEVRGFPSPFEVPAPEGCEGWESMYPYYALFSEERRESEEARGWFRDGMHFPEPMSRLTSSPLTRRICAWARRTRGSSPSRRRSASTTGCCTGGCT